MSFPLYAIHHPLLLMIASRIRMSSGTREAAVAGALLAAATVVELLYDEPVRTRLRGMLAENTGASGRPALDDADRR
jgi:peptidoglycan/LPS O-acetylase OafA/YrhL